MFVRTAPHVIDFYADLVSPLLEVAPGDPDAARTLGMDVTEEVQLGKLLTGEGQDTPADIAGVVSGRSFRCLVARATTRLLRFATGQELWPELLMFWQGRGAGAPKSLARRPGIILLTPHFARDQAAPDNVNDLPADAQSYWPLLQPGSPLVLPHVVDDTIVLYSGQQLHGTGLRQPWGLKTLTKEIKSAFDLLRGFPTVVFVPRVEAAATAEPDGTTDVVCIRAGEAGSGTSGVADRVTIRDLDISIDDTASALFAPVGPDGQPILPSPLPKTGIDLSNARHAVVSRVNVDRFDLGIRVSPSARGRALQNWIGATTINCRAPMSVGPYAEDCTIWSGHHSGTGQVEPTRLGGLNSQMWFAVVEPNITAQAVPAGARRISQVELAGQGSGVFCSRIEGNVVWVGAAPETPEDRVASVYIPPSSHLCHVSYSHLTSEGEPVAIDVDAAAALTRHVPISNVAQEQPELAAGLTNLLANSALTLDRQQRAPMWWSLRDEASCASTADPGSIRALSSALQLSVAPHAPARDRNRRAIAALWQELTPGPEMPIRSVADRTIAAGCWLRPHGGAGAWIRLTEELAGFVDAPSARFTESNRGVAAGWQFVSTILHTSVNARSIRFEVVAPPGASCYVSEPILVDGIYVPPWHPRPETEVGDLAYFTAILPGFLREVHLAYPGRLPGGREGVETAIGSAPVAGDGEIFAVRASIGQPAVDEVVCCWLTATLPGEKPRALFGGPPWVIRPSAGKGRVDQVWSERVDLPTPIPIGAGMRIELRAAVLRGRGDAPVTLETRPATRDLAVNIGIRGRI